MGAETWRRFIKPCWEKIYREVHRQGKVTIQHSCGSIAEIYDDLIEIGMDCHESVQPEAAGMAPDRLKRDFGSRLSFWGCLGTQGLLQNGTPGGDTAGNLPSAGFVPGRRGLRTGPCKTAFRRYAAGKRRRRGGNAGRTECLKRRGLGKGGLHPRWYG